MPRPALHLSDPPAAPDRRADLAADGVMSVAEAEQFLGLKTSQVYELMGRGELPFVKLGRRRLIPKRALIELLAANMTVDDGAHA